MMINPNFLNRSWKVIFTVAVLCILSIVILVAAGCLSPLENKTAGTVSTMISQIPTMVTPVSSTISGVKETNGSLQTTLPGESNSITQSITQKSPLPTSTITKVTTSTWDTTIGTPGSASHFYIVSFDAKPVTIQHNETYRIFVNLKVVNWEYNGGCAGDHCWDNLDTILIKLNIIGYPGEEIKFNSFGGGGEPKGSADIHVGYEIRDLPIGRYTLEFSTPDSVVRKDVDVI